MTKKANKKRKTKNQKLTNKHEKPQTEMKWYEPSLGWGEMDGWLDYYNITSIGRLIVLAAGACWHQGGESEWERE